MKFRAVISRGCGNQKETTEVKLAGADIIVTYCARDPAKWLQE